MRHLTQNDHDDLLAQRLCIAHNRNEVSELFGGYCDMLGRPELDQRLAALRPARKPRTLWSELNAADLLGVLNTSLPGFTFAIAHGVMVYQRA